MLNQYQFAQIQEFNRIPWDFSENIEEYFSITPFS